MSFFIGVLSLSDQPVRTSASELEAAAALPDIFSISRFEDSRLTLLHGDLGVFLESGWHESGHAVGAVGGTLLLDAGALGASDSNKTELGRAVAEIGAGRHAFLRNANGTFALCIYDRRAKRLTLAGDALGARPIYYVASEGQLYFATSIDALARLHGVPRKYDIATYLEEEALCYPLGRRTKLTDVRVIVDSEIVTVCADGVDCERYFDWRSLPLANEHIDDMAAYCRDALRRAVASRAALERRHTCLLSGGLDSRVVAAELVDLGYDMQAINVSIDGFQDRLYAQRFADAAGIPLSSIEWTEDMAGMSAADCTASLLSGAVSRLERTAVFSGDGGGETFGFLLMNAQAARLLNDGRTRAAVDEYLRHYGPPRQIFKNGAYERIRTVAADRMEAELVRIGTTLGEKALQILVLTNDLRCHLHEYFNRLPLTGVELHLPFYDRRVIESVLRIPPPLEPLMKHAFYHRMLPLLPPLVLAAPWQTYPGHAPCPIADDHQPPNQWSRKPRLGDRLAMRCARVAIAPGFAPVLRRSSVLAAVALHKARRSDLTYLFKACLNLQARCGDGAEWVLRNDELDNDRRIRAARSNR